MTSWFRSAQPLALATAVVVAFGACDEQLNGGAACPILCPGQQLALRDTTFFAVDLDTTIAGFPAFGAEVRFFLASMGDTLQTAAVVRYDSLPNLFRHVNSVDDSAIVAVDSAYLRLTIVTGDTLGLPTTVEVYDVDMDGAEEADPTTVAGAFTPDRLLGSRTIPADSLRDSLRVPIDAAKLLAKIQREDSLTRRLRVGIRVSSASETNRMSMLATNGGGAAQLIFRPSMDTTVPKVVMFPLSKTPDDLFIALDMADYQVVINGPADPPPGVLRIGGLPSRRAYLRFNIPSDILDSSNVVRATLQLTQRPNGLSSQSGDTIGIGHFGVLASPVVTDLSRALQFVQRLPGQAADTVLAVPADSGLREFEIIGWVRVWRGTKPEKTPRAIALLTPGEGISGSLIDFFSTEAAVELQPRLRITYLPRTAGQLP